MVLLLLVKPPIAATRSEYNDWHGPCDVGGTQRAVLASVPPDLAEATEPILGGRLAVASGTPLHLQVLQGRHLTQGRGVLQLCRRDRLLRSQRSFGQWRNGPGRLPMMCLMT
jgi:hypothetical protein